MQLQKHEQGKVNEIGTWPSYEPLFVQLNKILFINQYLKFHNFFWYLLEVQRYKTLFYLFQIQWEGDRVTNGSYCYFVLSGLVCASRRNSSQSFKCSHPRPHFGPVPSHDQLKIKMYHIMSWWISNYLRIDWWMIDFQQTVSRVELFCVITTQLLVSSGEEDQVPMYKFVYFFYLLQVGRNRIWFPLFIL